MPVTIQSRFTSAVVEADMDVFTRSYTEGENTLIEFDMRKRDYQKEAGINHEIYWPEKTYSVDIREFSTFQNPVVYRFISGQAWYYDDQNRHIWFTPKLREVSAQQHVSKSVLRPACFPAEPGTAERGDSGNTGTGVPYVSAYGGGTIRAGDSRYDIMPETYGKNTVSGIPGYSGNTAEGRYILSLLPTQ